MTFRRRITTNLAIVAAFALYLLGLHTYWPLGSQEQHLSNLDSVMHPLLFFGIPGLVLRGWRHLHP